MARKYERAYCPVCRKNVFVRTDGSLWRHTGNGGLVGQICFGSGMTRADIQEYERNEAENRGTPKGTMTFVGADGKRTEPIPGNASVAEMNRAMREAGIGRIVENPDTITVSIKVEDAVAIALGPLSYVVSLSDKRIPKSGQPYRARQEIAQALIEQRPDLKEIMGLKEVTSND